MIDIDLRAEAAAKRTAECQGLTEEVKNLLHTAYIEGASEECVLQKGYEGTFGQAVESLKRGFKVARKGWNGKGMFLWLKPSVVIKSEWCKDPLLKGLADENGGEIVGLGTICMKTADNKILTGWLASQTDMLSNDWVLV